MELLVVLFIVSVLLGIGVGVFGKFNLMNAAENAGAGIRAMIRVIRDHARNHGTVGTIVVDVKENRVVGLMERVVGQWHFENEEGGTTGAFGHDPALSGTAQLVPDGCIGGALKLSGEPGDQADLGRSVTFESDWGVSLSADVWLDTRETAGTILSKGDAYGLRVESDGALSGWVGVSDGEPGERLDVISAHSAEERVPVGKWARVGLYYDRVQLRLFIDYRQVADAQETRPLGRAPEKSLMVSGGTGAIQGKIDGVRLGVLQPGESGELPQEVTIKAGTRVIRFNPDGFLDPRYHPVPAQIVLEGGDGVTRTLTIGLMGDVTLE